MTFCYSSYDIHCLSSNVELFSLFSSKPQEWLETMYVPNEVCFCQKKKKKHSFCLSYSGKVGAPSKDKKEKKEKKKEEKPKAAPAPKEPEPVEEPDAADEALSLEPKSKDPFDAMPKGTFNFEDFKRFYSNNDEAVSIPYFWEKFDKENYSIWFGEYKYNEELTQVFMSCNLIGGELIKLVHFPK